MSLFFHLILIMDLVFFFLILYYIDEETGSETVKGLTQYTKLITVELS